MDSVRGRGCFLGATFLFFARLLEASLLLMPVFRDTLFLWRGCFVFAVARLRELLFDFTRFFLSFEVVFLLAFRLAAIGEV
jgi:hypothetical protein